MGSFDSHLPCVYFKAVGKIYLIVHPFSNLLHTENILQLNQLRMKYVSHDTKLNAMVCTVEHHLDCCLTVLWVTSYTAALRIHLVVAFL